MRRCDARLWATTHGAAVCEPTDSLSAEPHCGARVRSGAAACRWPSPAAPRWRRGRGMLCQRTEPNGRSHMRRTRIGRARDGSRSRAGVGRARSASAGYARADHRPGARVALGPITCPGVGDVAGDRPAIGAVALPAELHLLHHVVERARTILRDAISISTTAVPATPGQRQPHLGIGQRLGGRSARRPAACAARCRAQREKQHPEEIGQRRSRRRTCR